MKKILLILGGLIFATAILSSCREFGPEASSPATKTEVQALDVTLRLKTPGVFNPKTRALSDSQEKAIDDALVFGFKNNVLSYVRPAEEIVDNGATKSFIVTLKSSADASDLYKLVILANAQQFVLPLIGAGYTGLNGRTYEEVQQLLAQTAMTEQLYSNGGAIVMWGELPYQEISNHNKTFSLSLVRSISRIDVGAGATGYNPVTNLAEWGGLSNFTLEQVFIYKPNNGYAFIPAPANFDFNSKVAIKPTVVGSRSTEPYVYTVADGVSLINSIYLPEADVRMGESGTSGDANHKNRLAIVVQGSYDGNPSSYYRVDLINKSGQLMDLLRNHLYQFNIKSVSGNGFETPEDAYNSFSANMNVEVIEWNDAEIGDIAFDGQYMLGVSPGEFTLPMNGRIEASKDNQLTVITDVPQGWRVKKIADGDGSEPNASWLTLSLYEGVANVKTTATLFTTNNTSGSTRIAYIHIEAGRLTYIVKVTQTTTPELELELTDSFGNEINRLSFASHVGGTVPAQQFNVSWLPEDADLNVVATPLVGVFSWGTGDAVVTDVVSGQGGHIGYNIQPSPMTQLEIDADPFREKTIKLDYMVTNGSEYASKTIFLQQKNYAAVPTVAMRYLMDGSEHFFTIKSNASWTVEVVSDPNSIINRIINPNGGAYGDKRDEQLFFEIVNNQNPDLFEAEAVVVIKSTNPSQYFEDVTVVIKGYSIVPKRTLLTIGSSPNGYGYNFSGTAPSNKLITSATNFGLLENSVVPSEGFTIIDGGMNPSESQMYEWLVNNPVDMVVIGFDNYNLSTTIAEYYLQYLKRGGAVLAFMDRIDASVSRNFLTTVMEDTNLGVSYATGAGSVYRFYEVNNGILNGVFGDIRDLQWGEDASTTVRVYGLDLSKVDILSGDQDISTSTMITDSGYATAFSHKTLNLVWVGDGGFNSYAAGTANTYSPFRLDANNYPTTKSGYGRGTYKYSVYNTHFTANAITWAMKKTSINR